MKVTGLNGKGVGKLGKEVYSINHGVQIRREYNAEVNNPSTDGQVSQRGRFKLASQLSAAMQDVIVMQRKGMSSPRNQFVKRNIRYIYGSNDETIANYGSFQLTNGSMAIPGVQVASRTAGVMKVQLSGSAEKVADKMVYNIFRKLDGGNLMLVDSLIADEAGPHGNFPVDVNDDMIDYVVYAYGVKLKTSKAKAAYNEYRVQTGEDVARLMASQKFTANDIVFTQTSGVSILSNQSSAGVVDNLQCIVSLSATWPENVTAMAGADALSMGANIVSKGTEISLEAVDDNGFTFVGWYINGSQTPFTTERRYTFTASQDVRIVARFEYRQGLE